MLNFKAALETKVTNKQPTIYLARYINKEWYVKISGTLYPIQLPDIMTSTTFYSTPENPSHEAWTKRVIAKGKFTSSLEWWSPLYHGMKLKGKLVDGIFIIK